RHPAAACAAARAVEDRGDPARGRRAMNAAASRGPADRPDAPPMPAARPSPGAESMKTSVLSLLFSALLAAAPALSCAAPASTADVLVRHANIVDVEHGRVVADQAVAIRGGDI